MANTFPMGPVRVINAKNTKVAAGLMKTLHTMYVANTNYSSHEGEIHPIAPDEATRVNANYMLSARNGELYALVPFFYYTKRPMIAYFEHSVPKRYKTMYFICNYSPSLKNRKVLQATFLFCEAETYAMAFKELANIFTTITHMKPAHKNGHIFLPLDTITAVFSINENMGIDVPEPIRYCEYAYIELEKTKIKDVILILEL